MIASSVVKNSRFFLPRRIGLKFLGFRAGTCVHARLVGGGGAASYVAQETAKQVCQLFGESYRTGTRPIEDDRVQYAGVCTFPSELQTRHRKVHCLVLL